MLVEITPTAWPVWWMPAVGGVPAPVSVSEGRQGPPIPLLGVAQTRTLYWLLTPENATPALNTLTASPVHRYFLSGQGWGGWRYIGKIYFAIMIMTNSIINGKMFVLKVLKNMLINLSLSLSLYIYIYLSISIYLYLSIYVYTGIYIHQSWALGHLHLSTVFYWVNFWDLLHVSLLHLQYLSWWIYVLNLIRNLYIKIKIYNVRCIS